MNEHVIDEYSYQLCFVSLVCEYMSWSSGLWHLPKMEEATCPPPPDTLVCYHIATRCHNPEDREIIFIALKTRSLFCCLEESLKSNNKTNSMMHVQVDKRFPTCMEPEISLPCAQKPAAVSYPELLESISLLHIVYRRDILILTLSYAKISHLSSTVDVFGSNLHPFIIPLCTACPSHYLFRDVITH
jgi:hypothetical protein